MHHRSSTPAGRVTRSIVRSFVTQQVSGAASAAALAGASSIAYAGVGGTVLQAGVALGICSAPLIVTAAPVVASVLAVAAVGRLFDAW